MQLDHRSLRVAEDYQSYFSPGKILLISYIFVRAKKQLISGCFGLLNQFAVFQFVPANLAGMGNLVAYETASDRFRCAIIKQIFISRTLALS